MKHPPFSSQQSLCLYLYFSFFLSKHLTIPVISNGGVSFFHARILDHIYIPFHYHKRPGSSELDISKMAKWLPWQGQFILLVVVIKSVATLLLGTESKVHPEVAFNAKPECSLWIRWQRGGKCVFCYNSWLSWHLFFSNRQKQQQRWFLWIKFFSSENKNWLDCLLR